MSFPSDKEPGDSRSEAVKEDAEEQAKEAQPPSIRLNLLLLGLLAILWLVVVACKTLIEINRRFPQSLPMTSWQHYIYSNDWDLWLYNHDPYHLLHPQTLFRICVLAVTLSAILVILLTRFLPTKDGIAASAHYLFHITITLAEAWFDGTGEKGSYVLLLFAWTSGNIIWVLLHRAGFADLQARVGVSDRAAGYCARGSLVLFLVCMFFCISSETVVSPK